MSDDLGEVLSAISAWGQGRETEGRAEAEAVAAERIAELNATLISARAERDAAAAELETLEATLTLALEVNDQQAAELVALHAEYDAHMATHEPDPDVIPGWTLHHATEFDNLDGWSVRTETQSNDNSRNIPANVVPASIGGKGLTIWGKAEPGYNRPYTSGEIHGTAPELILPNYFRAEVIGTSPDVSGLWPCLLWFRPNNSSDGEIDVMEYMGGLYTGTQRRIAVTMHNEYGSTQDSWKAPLFWHNLTEPSITASHKYVIEKTPGQIKVTVDDEATRWFGTTQEVIDHLPQNGVTTPKAWWDRIMENPDRTWYPRITLQVGDGSSNGGKRVVPNPPAGFTADKMTVTSLKLWLPA